MADKLIAVLKHIKEQEEKQIENVVTEMMHPDYEMDWEDHEGEMANSELMAIVKKATDLAYLIDENDELDGWVQSKITKANDYISSVHDYLMYHSNKNNQ